MAYNYLGLVNQINRRLNEVELTSANFDTATGFYSQAKDAVNSSIRYVNQTEYNWPFNHVTQEDVLTPNIMRYGNPDDSKTIHPCKPATSSQNPTLNKSLQPVLLHSVHLSQME